MTPNIPAHRFDASGLEKVGFDYDSPLWWGQILMVVSEGVVFALLIAMYLYARTLFQIWPPPGVFSRDFVLPVVNVVLLIASCVPMRWGDKAVLRKDWPEAEKWSWVSVCMAVAAIWIQFAIMRGFQFHWNTHLYGSIVWFLMGLLTAHMIFATLETAAILAIAAMGHRDDRVRLALNVDEIYWFMVVIATIPVYAVVFLGPRLL